MKSTTPEGKQSAIDVNLTGSTFTDVCLSEARFDDVNLCKATFHNINLSDARFDDVNLSNVAISNANLDGMTINGVLVTDLLKAHHREC